MPMQLATFFFVRYPKLCLGVRHDQNSKSVNGRSFDEVIWLSDDLPGRVKTISVPHANGEVTLTFV